MIFSFSGIHRVIWLCAIAFNAVAGSHHPTEFLNSLKNDTRANQKVYEHYCALCHDPHPRIEVHAPRKGVAADWATREKKGIDGLFKSMDAGRGAMPPRGGCFECTDSLLKDTIRYMLPRSK